MRRPAVGISTAGPYRPDIDGLRAVAVIAVILFHARVPGFEGGYVGVDVFFVLSGYLITAQLLNAAGMSLRSMLAQFYVRRARRILPALFVVLAVVVVTAGIMLLPNDLERLGRDTLFSVIFAGNIAAWTSAGYFEIVLPVPLVHLWTIGVEEQFYLFFPLALWIALRYFRDGRLAVAVGGCALASFVICLWGADAHPRANFYWAPPRAWELLLGAVLAIRAPAPVANRLVRELLAAAAAATILLAIFLYDDNMWYPYFATLAPCVATVGLIFSGLQSPPSTNRILAIRPLVFIGLISYSLYLWHVPLQTFFEYYTIRRLDTAQTIGWLGATFVLAVASWMFIEKPIRERRYLQTTRHFVACLGIVAVALVVVGMLYWRSGGLPQRTPQSLLAILDGRNRWAAETRDCILVTPPRIAAGELCHFGSSDSSARRVIVWGDSHALALLPALRSLALKSGDSLYFAGGSACRPLVGVASRSTREDARRRCDEYNSAMLMAIEHIDPAVVILASFWVFPDVDLVPTGTPAPSGTLSAPAEELFEFGMHAVLDRPEMQGRVTCAVLDVPQLDYFVPHAYARAVRRGIDSDFIGMDRATARQRLAPAEVPLKRLQTLGALRLADPKQALCAENTCRFRLPTGELLYADSNHLSVQGAHYVAPTLEPCFR